MLALDCASSEFYKDGIYDYRKFEGDKGRTEHVKSRFLT
jgi:enolase